LRKGCPPLGSASECGRAELRRSPEAVVRVPRRGTLTPAIDREEEAKDLACFGMEVVAYWSNFD
jgi:hypothetical protein